MKIGRGRHRFGPSGVDRKAPGKRYTFRVNVRHDTKARPREPRVFRLPRTTGELRAFVAHFGGRHVRSTTKCSLENVVLRAVATSRRDPALARMLPVFLWRVRDSLDLDALAAKAVRQGCASTVGYFLDVTGKVGPTRTFSKAVSSLRPHVHADRPVFLFSKTKRYPWEAAHARENTPEHARRWGLLVPMPLEGYKSYFAKVAAL